MIKRHDFHNMLETVFPSLAVYYQPPTNMSMTYPCIVYDLDKVSTNHADNQVYTLNTSYTLTLITPAADPPELRLLFGLRYCRFDRAYTSQGLRHFVFNLYI